MIAFSFLACSKIIRRTRKDPALSWAKDLAAALQASLLAFCVSGAALSMAYYDLFIIEVAMLLALQDMLKVKKISWAPATAPSNELGSVGALRPFGAVQRSANL